MAGQSKRKIAISTPSAPYSSRNYEEDNKRENNATGLEEKHLFGDLSFKDLPKRPPSVPCYGKPPTNGSSVGKRTRHHWPASKELLDDYLNKKSEARRRSTCKEITLYLLRNDSKETGDHTKPRFKVIKQERFLETCEEELESSTDTSLTGDSITNTLSAISEIIDNHSVRLRSNSTDGYNSIDNKVKLNETRAFLFDSVPDIQDAIQKESFVEARKHRRHGQMYSLNEGRDLLEKLTFEDKGDKL